MFRNNISVYVDDEEMAKKVREYARQLRKERGSRINSVPPELQSYTSTVNPNPPVKTVEAWVELIQKIKNAPSTLQPAPESQPLSNQFNLEGIPELVLNVMNGGTFPAPEDLTREERAVVYDGQLNGLINVYRISKRPETAEQIKSRLRDLGVDL